MNPVKITPNYVREVSAVRKTVDLANTLGALALAIVDGMNARINESVRDPAAAAAINSIGFRPGLSIRMLSKLLSKSHSGTVRGVDRLVRVGLARRSAGDDARAVSLRLTSRGRQRWIAQRATRMRWLHGLVGTLSAEQRVALTEITTSLLLRLAKDPLTCEQICRLCDEAVCVPSRCPITDEDAPDPLESLT